MRVLLVSRYVDPNSIGGNKNVFLQAKALQDHFGLDVEILSWPSNDLWTGPMPSKPEPQIPALEVVREGLTYHIFTAPLEWNEVAGGNVIDEQAWEDAVAYGIELLRSIQPDIVHLHHRHGLWWLLESAQRIGIPTVYSNHDWGLACMRTILVMGDGALCDGKLNIDKCSKCIVGGRGFIGWLNEVLVQFSAGRKLATIINATPFGRILRQRGAVFHSAKYRTAINYSRASSLLKNLRHCFTPSEFGRQFFTQLGVAPEKITVQPWYHDPVSIKKTILAEEPFTITYIGRVSPEKGVHLIFSALELLSDTVPMKIRIAGANNSSYCRVLKENYSENVGIHAVEWMGWSKVEPLFKSTDVTIIPSVWMDNTPLSLIEALSYRVPVIATRIPSIEDLVVDNENAFLADYQSINSLADAIRRAESKKLLIRADSIFFPPILTINQYMSSIVNVYKKIYMA